MRGTTDGILQHHRILRLPRKMTVMTDPCHIYETLFTMHGTTDGILQHHRILRLPRKLTFQNFGQISRKQLKRHLQCASDPRKIRAGKRHSAVFVAGAAFGEVQMSLFVAGAIFREIGSDIAGSRNVLFFNTKCSWWARKVTSVARRVAD